MNKKITAVTLTALMVLTMFTAMVPTASAAKEVAAPYEFMGVTAESGNGTPLYFSLFANSSMNPSLLYFDLDDKAGNESVTVETGYGENMTIGSGNLTYITYPWPDLDTPTDSYIAWLGAKFFVADRGSTWRICEKLVDDDEDDDKLLRVGESLSLPEGWAITALEIDVDGQEAWMSLTQDGEEVENEVVSTEENADPNFVYKKDLGASKKTVVMNFTVETVFAGMNTNLVKINNIDLVSTDVIVVKNGDEDLMNDFEVNADTDGIEIKSNEDIGLSEDDVVDVLGGRFGVRVNDDEDYAAIVQTVIVGGGAAATPTEDLTVEPTVEPTETATGAATATAAATAVGTAVETEAIPEPTKEPGFEAVFAVAGLLAVAYLVLRQRE